MSKVLHITHIFDETGCLNLQGMRGHVGGSLGSKDKALAATHLKECELCAEAIGGIGLESNDAVVMASLSAMSAHARKSTGGNASGQSTTTGGNNGWIWQAAAAVAALAIVTLSVWFISPDQKNPDKFAEALPVEKTPPLAAPLIEEDSKINLPVLADREAGEDKKEESDADLANVMVLDQVLAESQVEVDEVEEEISQTINRFAAKDEKKYSKKGATTRNEVLNSNNALADVSSTPNDEIAAVPSLNSNADPALFTKDMAGSSMGNDDFAALEDNEFKETLAMQDVETDEDAADLNIGYNTDVYDMRDDKLTYKGTKNDLNKEKARNKNSKNKRSNSAPQNTSMASTKSAVSKSLNQVLNPPSGIYYDSDKSTWSNSQTLQDKAMSQYDVQNYTDAIGSFEEVIKVDPDNDEARFFGAISYFELGLYNNAEKHFDFLIDKGEGKHFEQAQWYLAEIHIRRNEMVAAKKLLRKIEKKEGAFKAKAKARLQEMK